MAFPNTKCKTILVCTLFTWKTIPVKHMYVNKTPYSLYKRSRQPTVILVTTHLLHSPKFKTSLCKGVRSGNRPPMMPHRAEVTDLRSSTEGATRFHGFEARNSSTSPLCPLPLPVLHCCRSRMGQERRGVLALKSRRISFSLLMPRMHDYKEM